MGSFGDKLRREREMRGITLDEISASTKISRRHLEELEAENFDALPGGIFNRGFVRAYARFLGIDEDQAVADYAAASGEQTESEPSFPIEVQEEDEPQLNPRRSSLPLVLALVALVIVLGVFWARSKRQPEANEAASSTPAPAPAVTSSPAPYAPSPTSSPVDTIAPAAAAESPSPAAASSPAAFSTASPSLSPERTFSVIVQAKEDAWIMVKADGKTVYSGKTMRAGEQQIVRAGKSIVLVTGNAGGVDISFNGKPLGSVGNESEVRTLTFTPTGLVQ